MKHVAVSASLVVFWIALWGDVTLANALSGVAISAVVLVAAPLPRPLRGELVVHPWGVVVFVMYFLRELIEASAVVAATIVLPRRTVTSGVVAVRLASDSDALTTIVANAVSLTPGTLTIEVAAQPPTLYIHVLHVTDVEQVRADVATLERRATNAFGSPASLDALRGANTQRSTPRRATPRRARHRGGRS